MTMKLRILEFFDDVFMHKVQKNLLKVTLKKKKKKMVDIFAPGIYLLIHKKRKKKRFPNCYSSFQLTRSFMDSFFFFLSPSSNIYLLIWCIGISSSYEFLFIIQIRTRVFLKITSKKAFHKSVCEHFPLPSCN